MPYVEGSEGELTFDELRGSAERVDLDEVGHPVWVALRMAHGLED